MDLDVLGSIESGIIHAMAADGWAALRTRIARSMAGTTAERDEIADTLDGPRAAVLRGDEGTARLQLRQLLQAYAASHPDAEATFQSLLTSLSRPTMTDNSVNTGNVTNSNIAGSGGRIATNGGIAGDGNTIAGRDVRQDNSVRNKTTHKGAGSAVFVVAGLVVLVLIILFVNHAKAQQADGSDGGSPTTTQSTHDPLAGVTVKTCGEWLRLPQSEGDQVARDIALRLGNREAARDPFLVQNVQYDCDGIENRRLADVLAPGKIS
ncbi:hypothetical protein [Streptomyces sp. NPDC001135]